MASEPTQILVYEADDTVIFRVVGRGTMCQSAALRRKAEQSLDQGVRRLLVDLRDCTYFDSTFLGTLLTLKRAAAEHGGTEFGLVAPSPACRRLLAQMQMDRYFPQVETVCEPHEASELCTDYDPGAFKWAVVCAHQELASLEGPEGASFRPLAERLAAEFKASRSQPSP